MSAHERITVELTPFEKVQILRQQLEDRQKELVDVEATIRDKLGLQETQRYLESLSPYYSSYPQEGIPTREEIEALETRRNLLIELVQTIEETIPTILEGGAQGQSTTSSQPAGPARKAKFDSFEDFAANT